jgi:hypothetical protein
MNTATITEENLQNTEIKNHNKLKIRNDAMKPCKAKRTEERFEQKLEVNRHKEL